MGPDNISIIMMVVKTLDMVMVLLHRVMATVKRRGRVDSSMVRVTRELSQLRTVLSYLIVSSLSLHPSILLWKKFYQAYNFTVFMLRMAMSISAFRFSRSLDSLRQPRSRHLRVKLANCILVYMQRGRTRMAQPTISNSWCVQKNRIKTALMHSATCQASSSKDPEPQSRMFMNFWGEMVLLVALLTREYLSKMMIF